MESGLKPPSPCLTMCHSEMSHSLCFMQFFKNEMVWLSSMMVKLQKMVGRIWSRSGMLQQCLLHNHKAFHGTGSPRPQSGVLHSLLAWEPLKWTYSTLDWKCLLYEGWLWRQSRNFKWWKVSFLDGRLGLDGQSRWLLILYQLGWLPVHFWIELKCYFWLAKP